MENHGEILETILEEVLNENENQEEVQEVVPVPEICPICGEEGHEVKQYISRTGDIIFCCEECYENSIEECHGCGKWVNRNSDTFWICSDYEYVLCDSCYENGDYHICDHCSDCFTRDDLIRTHYGTYVCYNCDSDYYKCNGCGDYFYIDDLHRDDYSEDYYCDNCIDEHGGGSDMIYDWHGYHGGWSERRLDNEESVPYYFGFELETGNVNTGAYENDIAEYLTENIPVVLERDGSIDAVSDVEVISHPMSYKYFIENKDKFKDAFDYMLSKGYISHKIGDCGLHMHFTRPSENSDDVVARLWLIVETFKNEILKYSGRNYSSHYYEWLSSYKGINEDDKRLKAVYFYKKDCNKNNTRYLAINNENAKTIELRFNRGTLKWETFMARIEFTNNLWQVASDLSRDITSIKWDDLIDGEYAKAYAAELELDNVDKNIKDLSAEIIAKENSIAQDCKKIRKEIMCLIKNMIKDNTFTITSVRNFDKLYSVYDKHTDSARCICNIISIVSRYDDYYRAGNYIQYLNNLKLSLSESIDYYGVVGELRNGKYRDDFQKIINKIIEVEEN